MIQETQTHQEKVEWGLPFFHKGFVCRAGKLNGKYFAIAHGKTMTGIKIDINTDVKKPFDTDREAIQELHRRIEATI